MKRLLLFFTFAFAMNCISGQQAKSYVLSPSGEISANEILILEWTLGEPIVSSIETPYQVYTQGFHQPFLSFEEIYAADGLDTSDNINLVIFPNPTMDGIEVIIESKSPGTGLLLISDLNRTPILQKKVEFKFMEIYIALDHIPAGTYIVSLISDKGLLLKSYKISRMF